MSNESLDLAALMDSSLDSVPEAPDYLTPPAGTYTIGVKDAAIESYEKEGDTIQRIRVTYVVEKTLELANAGEPPVPDNSMFSETFMGTQQGLGYFKKTAKGIMNVANLDGVSLGDIFSTMKGSSFNTVIKIRTTPKKGSKTEVYENVSLRIIPPTE